MGSNSNTIYDIIILGAGVSGIGMAHSLLKEKDQTFLIIEKNDGVGGTWRNNTYPGLCCDVPSHFYSYSFGILPGNCCGNKLHFIFITFHLYFLLI